MWENIKIAKSVQKGIKIFSLFEKRKLGFFLFVKNFFKGTDRLCKVV